MTLRITAALVAAMVLASGTVAAAGVCEGLCAPATQPVAKGHHGGGHAHVVAPNHAVQRAAMSAPECSVQMDARLERRTVNAPQSRQASTVAPAVVTVSQFKSTAPGEPGAVTSSPPDLEISPHAIPLRI